MRLPKRDILATALVLLAGVLYLLWTVDAAPPGLSALRATGAVVLGLGFAASASAVVPGFDAVIHGSKSYLAVTSLIGLVAFVAGVQMLVATSELALGVMVGAMGVLWLISTVHHMSLAETTTSAARPVRVVRHGSRHAGMA